MEALQGHAPAQLDATRENWDGRDVLESSLQSYRNFNLDQKPLFEVAYKWSVQTSNSPHDKMMQSPLNLSLVPPRCEVCGGTMKLVRRQPRLGPHPELLSFRCQHCGHVVTLVAEDER